ncbi:MAG: metallopeptidase family protein [Kiritimatiellia bacterium]|jgi:predicted Zn-dependent protease with MMP-like domain
MPPRPRRNRWYDWAEAESERILAALPSNIRKKLGNILITLEAHPAPEDEDDDLLGLFTGCAYGDELAEADLLPPTVRLFIENLRLEADDNPRRFREEVRTTLLHEIGHYLGLEEDDLDDLGIG